MLIENKNNDAYLVYLCDLVVVWHRADLEDLKVEHVVLCYVPSLTAGTVCCYCSANEKTIIPGGLH